MSEAGFFLSINNEQTINNIKHQFNSQLPFLKIEFFRAPHAAGQTNRNNKIITSDLKLIDLQKKKNQGKINIDEELNVRELEKKFEEEFGLYIQVFRKSGNVWLETSATDNWTLKQQNEEGKLLEQHFKIEIGNSNKAN